MFAIKKTIKPVQQKEAWRSVWRQRVFRNKLVIVLALNIPLVILLPAFFQHIEQRNGIRLHDILLDKIPATDVSLYIFIVIWLMSLLTLVRAIQQPEILITFLFSFFALSISRIITISLVPLNPPQGLIPLIDPLSNTFYGGSFATKDLFYSGHVATQFLMFLCLKKGGDKMLAAISTTIIALLVLVQHVHYSIDIIAAPLFAFICFLIGKRIGKEGILF